MTLNDIKITVAIPVGPKAQHQRWLDDCFKSVLNQTTLPTEILLVDDSANIPLPNVFEWYNSQSIARVNMLGNRIYASKLQEFNGVPVLISKYNTPCLLGIPAVFNVGIALATCEYVLQLGSDDTLEPTAVEEAKKCIYNCSDKYGMYNFSCKTIGNDPVEEFNWYNHANVMSKTLWREVGGYHPFTSIGGTDAAFNSICMVHFPNRMHKISDGKPLYNVRKHGGQYTLESAARYGTYMVQIRNDLTAEWKPNNG